MGCLEDKQSEDGIGFCSFGALAMVSRLESHSFTPRTRAPRKPSEILDSGDRLPEKMKELYLKVCFDCLSKILIKKRLSLQRQLKK